MISPFEVYLVLQLDSIKFALILFSLFGLFPVGLIIGTFLDDVHESKKLVLFSSAAWVLCAISATLTPSTKTAAAMIILPALTSKEVTEPLAKEGKELYALAKQALRDAVDSKDTKPEPSK